MRKKQKSAKKLKDVCTQAHNAAKYKGKVGVAVYDTRTLDFDKEEYISIRIDLLLYALSGLKLPEGAPNFFYITKGLRADCVYYLVPTDSEAMNLKFGKHVCGIDIEGS